MNDIRFAFRKLRQSPAFTSIAILTLALGIGLNTAIFSLINDLFLKGLPFKDPARVVHLYGGDKSRDLVDIGVGAPRFQHFRDGQTAFESLAGENFFAFTLTGLGDAVQVFGVLDITHRGEGHIHAAVDVAVVPFLHLRRQHPDDLKAHTVQPDLLPDRIQAGEEFRLRLRADHRNMRPLLHIVLSQ